MYGVLLCIGNRRPKWGKVQHIVRFSIIKSPSFFYRVLNYLCRIPFRRHTLLFFFFFEIDVQCEDTIIDSTLCAFLTNPPNANASF